MREENDRRDAQETRRDDRAAEETREGRTRPRGQEAPLKVHGDKLEELIPGRRGGGETEEG